uniref:Uncharacterized protein n=1 Tax=Polyblepharides amylifera TaxID=1486889 RepID=A0A7R9XN89_9CHLO|mmetsp:Transcript_1160/g.1630  ORF Transcript_1160/g.1630 Transcript_1160/m.1630 type:complete len:264 (+) Transcript_1160:115-906(+)
MGSQEGNALPWARQVDTTHGDEANESGVKRTRDEMDDDTKVLENVQGDDPIVDECEEWEDERVRGLHAKEEQDRGKLSELQLGPGVRVEVLWDVAEGEGCGENTSSVWWGGKLVVKGAPMYDCKGNRVWQILYDPKPELDEKFVDEVALVTFLSDHELFDMELECVLPWKKEGEERKDDIISMTEWQQEMLSDSGIEEGANLDQVCCEALSELPPEKQFQMAAGYRDFADHLKSRLAGLLELNGPNYVVTVEDIQTITRDLKR